ncbi:putative membrane protein [Desulfosporosinus orientis DSM 765]|uniref:Putative membrane protein n=1 Tax=Desulfosporosinus orientis (strain ATCC 19365 / DSM 765 / NCIMB 8382 / VKM B-1628 / Singapore I) TaxID=768706 RepID=G7WBS5_DESOD|nr:DUF6198 family protein [Desulfosporosinus orientis]AET69322.1 putative membrane protein [Desulfosporosinus orientis DSM 765]
MTKRLLTYLLGLFLMTIGIGFSIKSNLGVSPVSSIPYTITLIAGIEMGKATILFHIILILMQIVILRKDFKIKNLSQLVVAVIFGYFTTFSNHLMTFLPTPENYAIRLLLLLISIIFVAFGIFLYLPPDIVPLAGEGAMQAVSQKTGIAFPRVKVAFDTSMVLISGITCLSVLHGLGSVGAGTIISAVLVGTVLSFIMKLFRERLDEFLKDDCEVICY